MVIRGAVTTPNVEGYKCPHVDATLAELNRLVGNKAHFSFEKGTHCFVVDFPSVRDGGIWCDRMNHYVFPMEGGAILGRDEDSAHKELGCIFRFPMNFYYFSLYIGRGEVFFKNGKWDCKPELKKVGRFDETSRCREHFEVWMHRQIGQLEKAHRLEEAIRQAGGASPEDELHGPEIVD
jgi:hypothetical protein